MVPLVSVYDNLGGHSASFEKYWLKLYFLCLLMKCVIWEKIRGDPEVRIYYVFCFSACLQCPLLCQKRLLEWPLIIFSPEMLVIAL